MKNICIYGSLLTYLTVISEIDSRCKILEIFGGKYKRMNKKTPKTSNNEPMGPHGIQGTPAFCLGQSCC